jgi:sialate O-acetylesterase
MNPRLLLLFLALVPLAPAAQFAPVFTSGAVLQRDQPITLWGTGRDGEHVTLELLGHAATTTVSAGRWLVTLPALPATESTTLRLRGDNVVELRDVALGEVWLCTGQSNMEWRLNQCPPFTDDLLRTADDPGIRQIKIPLRAYAGDPLPVFAWKKFDRANAGQFSAVAYYFAADVRRRLGVVVGLVNCSFGGTPIEAWLSRPSLLAAGESAYLAQQDAKLAAFPDATSYEAAWAAYLKARAERDARQKAGVAEADLGPAPTEPYGYRSKGRPAGLHGAMFSLITPYTARGVLWYQGENNAGATVERYAALLRALIAQFRSEWNAPALPFFIAQVSSPTANWPEPEEPYARLREAQRLVATTTPHSGFVVTMDYGEHANVHPKQKQPIGERFARLALASVYGVKGLAAQSPSAASVQRRGDELAITFADLPGRLVIRDAAVPHLDVQLADGTWRSATARLSADAKSLVLPLAAGEEPRAVRYAYRNFGPLSLYTDEGLPVSPWLLRVSP